MHCFASQRQEQLDRLSKRLALCLFLATVAFIVARRLWLPNPAPYIRLARRVAAPLVPAQWKQQRPPSEEEQGLPFPLMAPPVALPSKGKGEEAVDVGVDGEVDAGDGGSLVGRAKEAWRTLAEGLEEIKEMQQLEQEQEQQAAEAEAAAVAAAAGEVEQEQEGTGVVVEEQEEPRPPPQMEEQQEEEKEPPQDKEEEGEKEMEFVIKVERFQPQPPPPEPAEEEEEEEEAAQGAEPAPPTRDDETPAPHEEL